MYSVLKHPLGLIRQKSNGKPMKFSKPEKIDKELEPFIKLIQIMRDDPLINKKVIKILKLDSYQRRIVLNNWLEQLRRQNAPENLRQALTSLFDDTISEKVLTLINKSVI
jgi:hypothetical protein